MIRHALSDLGDSPPALVGHQADKIRSPIGPNAVLQVWLEAHGMDDPSITPHAAPSPDAQRAGAISGALKALLDPVPGSRKVLTHLAALEVDLRRHGTSVLGKVSTPLLVKIGQELATLPVASDNAPMQDLMGMLLAELDARSGPRRQYLSTFDSSEKLEVSEGSHTDFMNVLGASDAKPTKP